METLIGPFFAVEGADVAVFRTPSEMAAHIEVYDIDVIEFFAGDGTLSGASTEGYRVTDFARFPGVPPNPARLEESLRAYLAHAREPFRKAAAEASSLDELIQLRLDLGP